ncbi:MAG: nucleotidyltransferase family protein [Candidatus Scalindua sp.]
MNRINIDIPKEKIAEFSRKWKVREFSLFGSVLRHDFQPESDIDIFVTFKSKVIVEIFLNKRKMLYK